MNNRKARRHGTHLPSPAAGTDLALDQCGHLRAVFLTGIQLRYIGLIDVVSFQTAVITHNVLGFILIANFCLWLGFYLCSPRIRAYHAETNPVRYFIGAVRQTLYYSYGIFRNMPSPFRPTPYRKFNPLQAMTYQILMIILMPIQMLTGILLWNLGAFPAPSRFSVACARSTPYMF